MDGLQSCSRGRKRLWRINYLRPGFPGFPGFPMASFSQKKRIKRVVEYGPYIPTLARLLEEGYFE